MKPTTTRVLRALIRAAMEGDGWACGRALRHPTCAGWDARKRVSELRAEGLAIATQVCTCTRCRYARDKAKREGRPAANVVSYRLVDPAHAGEVLARVEQQGRAVA